MVHWHAYVADHIDSPVGFAEKRAAGNPWRQKITFIAGIEGYKGYVSLKHPI